jgi:hypothetical protein
LHRSTLEWHYLRTKSHADLPGGSEVISGGHTDRETDDLISLLSFLESRLERKENGVASNETTSILNFIEIISDVVGLLHAHMRTAGQT